MLTYETLRGIEQEERAGAKLTKLPDKFFEEVKEYFEKKLKMLSEKTEKWELETAKSKIVAILELRERKIIGLAHMFIRSGVIPGNMTAEERELFNQLVNTIRAFRERRKSLVSDQKKETAMKTLAFLQDVPKFIGTDAKYYGPYGKNDIATVPEDNARLLIDKGMAGTMDAKNGIDVPHAAPVRETPEDAEAV
jgi:DNA replication initiation complex subunit (GINS family)